MVFTRTTTYVNVVSEPKVTVAEKVVASKVKNIVTPGWVFCAQSPRHSRRGTVGLNACVWALEK